MELHFCHNSCYSGNAHAIARRIRRSACGAEGGVGLSLSSFWIPISVLFKNKNWQAAAPGGCNLLG